MRISDWSSDVCSSDLVVLDDGADGIADDMEGMLAVVVVGADTLDDQVLEGPVGRDDMEALEQRDRKSVGWGKSVSVRVDLGGRRIIKKKINVRRIMVQEGLIRIIVLVYQQKRK